MQEQCAWCERPAAYQAIGVLTRYACEDHISQATEDLDADLVTEV